MRLQLTSEFLAENFEVDYLVNPILPAGGVGLIHGKGGHGKTQLAFTLIGELIRGGMLFGRYPVREGKALLFEFDMPKQLLQERLRKAALTYDEPDRLAVVAHERPVNILEPDTQAEIRAQIEQHEPSLVIFDTLRKLHPYEENDNAVPSQVYGAIREICAGASALIIHHDRKAPSVPGVSDEEVAESFRGARAWVDDCDLGMRVKKRGSHIMADWSKLRCAEQGNLLLKMNPETLLLEARPPGTAREWMQQLALEFPEMERSELVKLVAERAQVSPQAARKALREG